MWTLTDADKADIEAELIAPPIGRTSLWHMVGYAIASLVLTAGLLAQIGYRHLDRISQHDTLRPWLQSACELAGCLVPDRLDSSLIISNQLSISPHPEYQDISQMTLRFTNTAGFPQPLPAIELIYTDIHGEVVAGRRLSPDQYLDPSPSAPSSMARSAQQDLAAQESLTVQLEFATPADDAVNYQVRFVHE